MVYLIQVLVMQLGLGKLMVERQQVYQQQEQLTKAQWREHTKPTRLRDFLLLLFLMIIVAFVEVFTIGALVPFLAALTNPVRLFEHELAQPFIQVIGINSADELLLPLTLLFIVLTIFVCLFVRLIKFIVPFLFF